MRSPAAGRELRDERELRDRVERPAALGFRMPAEWEPHRATWIAWPHHRPDWPGKFPAIPWVFAEVVRHLTRSPLSTARPRERVAILVASEREQRSAQRVLEKAGAPLEQVEFHRHATDRVWSRDFGPLFVRAPGGEVAITDWKFNGWAKYGNHQHDDKIPARLARTLGLRTFTVHADGEGGRRRRVVLEGGSIDVNGLGSLLTTEECLLSEVQARNPGLGREGIERALADHLGARRVIWLKNGIVGDDTHGHVDDLARFVGPRTVVACAEPDRGDDNHAALAENLGLLRAARDQDGSELEVIELPMPAPVRFGGVRLPASYANFYIGNHAVLVPTFNDPNDRRALGILEARFPDRCVVGVHALDLVWGLGTFHCMTQQEPLGTPLGTRR
jgi:agmatine deiminase